MKILYSLCQPIDWITRIFGKTAAWLNIVIMLVIVTDVVLRRFVDIGSVTLQELEWHCHAALFLLASAYTLQFDKHVRIDLFYSRFSQKQKAWVDFCGCLFFLLPYVGLLAWLSLGFVERAWTIDEVSDAPGGLPMRWLIKLVMPVAFVLLFLQGVSQLLKKLRCILETPVDA